uniref:Glutathione S-transferase D12 n=1 Tax=Bemisia tabaci TaxID=7038 RepID=A0A6C0MC22_BEMTA|nr:glutathione S-transferase D12 [Bemisia tabaci]
MMPFPLPPGPPPFMPWMSGPPIFGPMGIPWPPPPPPPFMMPFGGPPRGGKGAQRRPQWPQPPRPQNQQRPNGQNPRKPVDLYHNLISSPSRGVRLAAKLIGVPLNLKSVDLAKQEQMQPSFLRMNPQHTVPTMDDNGFYLSESRAIITYLANKYGKHKNYLYPKDPERRGVIDQRLYFDMGTLFQRFADYWLPYMFAGAPLDEAKLKKLEEAFKFFDDMLKGSVYAAGDRITVADAALASTVSTIEAVGVIDVGKYPNVSRWYRNVKNAIPDYENTNQKGALAFAEFANAMISKRKNA